MQVSKSYRSLQMPANKVWAQTLLIMLLALLATSAQARQSDWEKIVIASASYAQTTQQSLEDNYKILSYERWDVDQKTGELIFSDKGQPKLLARFQFVGSFSERNKTWLWSWGNGSITPALYKRMEVMKSLGEKHQFQKLIDRSWTGELTDAWEMAAVANYLLKAKGIYRAPFDGGYVFMVITDVKPAATP
ncbi:DUF6882 domain-containing protein [Undibacterium sp. JH2W]|uniref:DUF6882 domain-containing protein n=1 Tax=Undibacterium sp. JH2W TaxID=3413037 RepID=UPI003BF18FC1